MKRNWTRDDLRPLNITYRKLLSPANQIILRLFWNFFHENEIASSRYLRIGSVIKFVWWFCAVFFFSILFIYINFIASRSLITKQCSSHYFGAIANGKGIEKWMSYTRWFNITTWCVCIGFVIYTRKLYAQSIAAATACAHTHTHANETTEQRKILVWKYCSMFGLRFVFVYREIHKRCRHDNRIPLKPLKRNR